MNASMLRAITGSLYTAGKPKGPVLENTKHAEVATPTVKRGFVMPGFLGRLIFQPSSMVSGQMGLSARLAARLRACFQHLPHPLRLKTQTVDSLFHAGTKTMTAINSARITAPITTAQPASIPAHHLQAVLAAFNASNMASSYIERGNFSAARRKLVQALASVNQLTAEA